VVQAVREQQLRIDELARLADERAARIARLEGQLRALAYGGHTRKTVFDAGGCIHARIRTRPPLPQALLLFSCFMLRLMRLINAVCADTQSVSSRPALAPAATIARQEHSTPLRGDQNLFEVTIESGE
jgi:hypothetical protein